MAFIEVQEIIIDIISDDPSLASVRESRCNDCLSVLHYTRDASTEPKAKSYCNLCGVCLCRFLKHAMATNYVIIYLSIYRSI